MTFCYPYQVRHSEDLCRVLRAHAPLMRGGTRPLALPSLGVCHPPSPLLSVRATRAPRACRASAGYALGVGVRPHAPWGLSLRALRARALPCALPSVLLALPPTARSLPPAPHPRGALTPRYFRQNKKALPFQARLLRIHPRSRFSTPLWRLPRSMHPPLWGETRRVLHTSRM